MTMWLRGGTIEEHRHDCDLPSLSKCSLRNSDRITKWRWMCTVCGHVYRPVEGEGMGPAYEWARVWPWTEWFWWWRSGSVF